MDIVTLAPMNAATLLWQTEPGQWVVSVCVKMTLSLAPGEAVSAERQEPLSDATHWDGDPRASLFYPGDFVPLKAKTDVVLVGHAYAPRGSETRSLVARVRVGDMERALRLAGDRVWGVGARGLGAGAPQPFSRMPLRYELAQRTADNPVGVDAAAKRYPGGPALWNIEEALDGGTPGFGPLATAWPARARRASDDGLAWARSFASRGRGRAVAPSPPGFDFRFFNAAPPEQQVELVRTGTPIELENLSAEHALLETRLPAARPRAFRLDAHGARRGEEIALRCDTLWIDTDRALCVTSWRGIADLGSREEDGTGRIVIVSEPAGRRLRPAMIESMLALHASRAEEAPETSSFIDEPTECDPLAVRHDAVKVRSEPGADAAAAGTGPASGEPPHASPSAASHPLPQRLELIQLRGGAPAHASAEPEDADTNALGDRAGAPESERQPLARPAPLDPTPAPPAAPVSIRPVVEESTTQGGIDEGWPTSPPWAPPPELGVPAVVDADTSLASGAVLPIEQYAALCAEITARPGERALLVRAAGATEAAWAKTDRHWTAAMAEHAERGSTDLLVAYDEAYLASQARSRGPLGALEYARIAAALERGEVLGVLAELRLELADVLRVQRVWSRRIESDPDLGREVRRHIEALRARR